jgi:NADH dehydrogenase/NADH:ubiquinone oxidoreductase subunit G
MAMAWVLRGGTDGALSLADNNSVNIFTLPTADFGDSVAVVVRHIDDAGLDNSALNFTLAPNPAQSELNVNWFNQAQMTIQVYDVCGKLLFTREVEASSTQLNIQGLSAGTYLLQLNGNNGTVVQKKFVKQ